MVCRTGKRRRNTTTLSFSLSLSVIMCTGQCICDLPLTLPQVRDEDGLSLYDGPTLSTYAQRHVPTGERARGGHRGRGWVWVCG
jgi:hypothetical protein